MGRRQESPGSLPLLHTPDLACRGQLAAPASRDMEPPPPRPEHC